MKVKLMN